MALPHLTPDQRAAALEKAAVARQVRAELKQQLKTGELKLSDALKRGDEDEIIGKLKVTALLGSLPGVGVAKTEATMSRIGIAPSRRIAGLGPHQRQALIEIFG